MATTPGMSGEKGRPTALWAVLAFTFINSLGTGGVTLGIYFLTKAAYGFGRSQNYLLGLLLGVTYIAGALAVAPGVRAAARRVPWLSSRGVLVAMTVVLGLVCALPAMISPPPAWAVWAMMAVYGPLSGAVWPLVESYLSGGRRGARLRGAIGLFNVVWAAAVVAAFWMMGGLLEAGRPILALAGLGGLHAVSVALVAWFGPEPPRHLDDAHEPHPAVYRDLLIAFRWLLPTSYVVMSTLSPFLPGAFARLGIGAGPAAWLVTSWMLARVVTFVVFERWHGWHGRWWVVGLGLIGLSVGLGVVLLSATGPAPEVEPEGFGWPWKPGVWVVLGGLVVFGVAQGVVYVGSLYYAMEVGASGVDAGGAHEGLIGVGYTLGPLCGLIAGMAFGYDTAGFEPGLLLMVLGITGVACGVTGWQIRSKGAGRRVVKGAGLG